MSKTVTILMLTTACGPDWSYSSGVEYSVSEDVARPLVDGKYAKLVSKVVEPKPEPNPEPKSEPKPEPKPVETAKKAPGKKRPGRK